MTYTTIKRYRRKGIGGDFNIPWGTALERRDDGILYHDNRPVCVARSYASHEHFCRDDDGNGAARGKLSHAIIKALGGYHRETTPEWEAVWSDETAGKYRRKDHKDYWLWDDAFFNAPLEDLRHIAGIVGAKEAKN